MQKRLLHCLSQHAEKNLCHTLLDTMPQPCPDDEYHPAMKSLGSTWLSVCAVFTHTTREHLVTDMFAAKGWEILADRRQAEGAAGHPTLPEPRGWLLRELPGQVAERSRSTCYGANTQHQDHRAALFETLAKAIVAGRPRTSSSGTCARRTNASRRLDGRVRNACEQ